MRNTVTLTHWKLRVNPDKLDKLRAYMAAVGAPLTEHSGKDMFAALCTEEDITRSPRGYVLTYSKVIL